MFNKLHNKKKNQKPTKNTKKKHHYNDKPMPLITSYLFNPEQPSPFITIGALTTSTWWLQITSWYIYIYIYIYLCNYACQKYVIPWGVCTCSGVSTSTSTALYMCRDIVFGEKVWKLPATSRIIQSPAGCGISPWLPCFFFPPGAAFGCVPIC